MGERQRDVQRAGAGGEAVKLRADIGGWNEAGGDVAFALVAHGPGAGSIRFEVKDGDSSREYTIPIEDLRASVAALLEAL